MIRMHQPMGQHSVIGQQQQSLRVIIKPSHREQSSGITGEKVLNGSPSLGIIQACYAIPGLVQRIHFGFWSLVETDFPAFHRQMIGPRKHGLPRFGHRFSIEDNTAGMDQFFCFPA